MTRVAEPVSAHANASSALDGSGGQCLPEPIGLRRPRRWNDAFGGLSLAIAPTLWAIAPTPGPVLIAALVAAHAYFLLWLWLGRSNRAETARLEGKNVVVRRRADGSIRASIPHTKISNVEPLIDKSRIELRLLDARRALHVALHFDDDAAARAWLDAIPIGTKGAAFPLSVASIGETLSPLERRLAAALCVIGSLASLLTGGPSILQAPLMILIALAFAVDVRASEHGIQNGLPWSRRTYRWQDIRAIEETDGEVKLVTHAGRSHGLLLVPGATGRLLRERAARTFRQLLAHHRQGES